MKNNQNVIIYCLLIIIVVLLAVGGTYIYSLQDSIATETAIAHPAVCTGNDKFNILTGAPCPLSASGTTTTTTFGATSATSTAY